MITFFGDWHGDGTFARRALSAAIGACADVNTDNVRGRGMPDEFVHVGDFGFWGSELGIDFLMAIERKLALEDRVIRVVPGNHENWDELKIDGSWFRFESYDADGFMMSRMFPHIRVCDRIAMWECDGQTLAALAGANSIDREWRTPRVSWWPQESPTLKHVSDLITLLGGRSVDVLVTHDAPASALDALRLYDDIADSHWSPAALAYARESANVVDEAMRLVRPTRLICGHHHVRRDVDLDGTAVTILNDNRGAVNDNRLTVPGAENGSAPGVSGDRTRNALADWEATTTAEETEETEETEDRS